MYNSIYYGPYNDKIYKSSNHIGDVLLNQLLIDLGLTLETAKDYRKFPEYLQDEILERYPGLESSTEDYILTFSSLFIRNKFSEYTNNNFELDKNFNVKYLGKDYVKSDENYRHMLVNFEQ